ncbi:phosphatase PAP2 family protein [Prevotella sp. kh1p2]|uniref:phosphatase PAP2 family protein n=1 Tax=Prevotella sp. kh1p2 TaxID=1761883 RepID=UPI0008B65AA9|nr:phosphatase PAP2 family protein [Prevotella sp. kh1p2]SES86653.1 PAP2 superfamily protein [Prevotella sp. kh1p2]SNU11107.1 PAP2 superfamily protein [Prevotellaceae bacterium KH2P17]
MKHFLINLFKIDRQPRKGLLPVEWVMGGYLLLTLLIVLFAYTKIANPESMITGRMRIVAITVALWIVYRLVPCRFTVMLRVLAQMLLLGWWYPDTYEINRLLPNLDHVFATWEQGLFGFQPALVFAANYPQRWVSELMDMAYSAYFPLIATVAFFYFFRRYKEFQRCAFVIMASFFVYYVVFILLPVAGPMFYYKAVGTGEIARGIFPDVGYYFNSHRDMLPSPGWKDGFFYQMVADVHAAGERPTAAFPSSHVGISTVCMLLAWHSGNRRLFYLLLPFYVLLCLSTVYIQAHYAIDALAGLVTGALLYGSLMAVSRKMRS